MTVFLKSKHLNILTASSANVAAASNSQKNGGQDLQPASTSRNNGGVGGNPVNLVPRMNELLQQVPPNVSIPDTPDLDSLILLQERRRRISSGGSVKLGQPQSGQPQQASLPPTGSSSTATRTGPQTQQQQNSFNPQQNIVLQGQGPSKGQLLMQQLTSGPSRGSIQPLTMSRSISYIEATPSNSAGHTQQQQPQLFVSSNGTPQVLARRSSFSGISPVGSISPVSTSSGLMSSPPPPGPPQGVPSGAAAAAAAAVAAASAGVLNPSSNPQQAQVSNQPQVSLQVARTLPQRHASGGTVHHPAASGQPQLGQRPQLQILANVGPGHRRLSDSVEIPVSVRSEDKQRSLLQQLLSE